MKKALLLSFTFIIFVSVLLPSCTSAKDVQIEYVPVEYDWDILLDPITQKRPDYVRLIDSPESLSDIMQNSVSFQYAYENWKDYALALESVYQSIKASE